jgi:iron complex outermembrane receptor protein
MNKKIVLLAFIFSFLFFASYAQQDGSISGTVVEKETGSPLIGAQIYVSSTSDGTITDLNGKYTLPLPPGTYTVRVSYISYTTQSVEVEVKAGENLLMDFSLSSDLFGLDEVVVTATFTERTQQESPLSMTSLGASQIERLTSNSQADILRVVPGIQAEGGGGEVASNVFVRGMPSGGQYQFTPLQVDGLPVISAFGLNSSAHDVYFRNDFGIRNLEFVRGGVAILYGAGSVAGIINYSSVTGSAIPENKVQLEWGSEGRARMDFLSAGPMGKNTFYSFSGFYRYDEGPLETGLNTVGAQLRGNIKTLLDNGKGVFTISGQYIDDKVVFYLPYPLENNDGTYERPTGNDGNTVFTTLTSQATSFSFDTPNGRYNSQINNGVMTKGGYIMADLKYKFDNDFKLSAKTRYANYDHQFNLFLDGDGVHNVPETQAGYLADRGLVSGDFTYVNNGKPLDTRDLLFQNRILDRERPMSDLASDINLSKEYGVHNLTIGAFYSYTTARDDNWIYSYLGDFRNAPEMVDLVAVDTNGNVVNYTTGGYVEGSGAQTSNRYHTMQKTALYLSDQIVLDRFSFDIGFRFENAKGFINRETGVASNTFEKGEVSTSSWALTAAGLYKATEQLNVYANVARGYFFPELRSVRFLPGQPGVTQSYEPEQIIQAEIGAKFGSSKFAGTLAGYFVSLSDRRSVDFENDGQGGVTEIVRVQSTQTIGVEATANYYITNTFNLFGNLTYQNHQFTKVEGNKDQEGNWLRRQPQLMGMLGATYDNRKFDVTLSHNMFGKRYSNDANTVELDPYGLMRFDIGYTFDLGTSESVRLGFAVFNVLDSQGITEGSPRQGDSQIGGGNFFVGRPILPRRYFARLTFNF